MYLSKECFSVILILSNEGEEVFPCKEGLHLLGIARVENVEQHADWLKNGLAEPVLVDFQPLDDSGCG